MNEEDSKIEVVGCGRSAVLQSLAFHYLPGALLSILVTSPRLHHSEALVGAVGRLLPLTEKFIRDKSRYGALGDRIGNVAVWGGWSDARVPFTLRLLECFRFTVADGTGTNSVLYRTLPVLIRPS